MKEIFATIKDNTSPHALARTVKSNTVLWDTILRETKIYTDISDSERMYIWYYDVNPLCQRGNHRKYNTFVLGYRNSCNINSNCECLHESRSKASSAMHASRTPEQIAAMVEKQQKTMIEKYGVLNPMHDPDIVAKLKQTNIERYGSESAFSNASIQLKCQSTLTKKYGVPYAGMIEESHAKRREFCINKYGVDNTMHIARAAYKEQTGMDNYFCSSENQAKAKETMKRRYGVEHALQVPEFLNKSSTTLFENYGRKNAAHMQWSDAAYTIMANPEKLEELYVKLGGAYPVANHLNVGIDALFRYLLKYEIMNTDDLNARSIAEDEFLNIIIDLGFSPIRNKSKLISNAPRQQIDYWIDELGIGIEFNGLFYHGERSFDRDRTYHINKCNQLQHNGYQLITVYSDEFANNRIAVESELKRILKLQPIIDVMDCIITYPTWYLTTDFLTKNHIFGAPSSETFTIGVEYNGALVTVMTYTIQDNIIEIIRYCTSHAINGGLSLLLSTISNSHPTISVYGIWLDRRWCNGKEFINEGFKCTFVTNAGYEYTDYKTRIPSIEFSKDELLNTYDIDEETLLYYDEWEIVQELTDLDRIWDCGKIRLEKII